MKNALKGTIKNAKLLLQIFKQYNEEVQALVDIDYSAASLERYKNSFGHTENFMKWKYGVADIDVKKLNFEFISQYEFWIKTIRK